MNTVTEMEKLLSYEDVAERLGMSVRGVYRLVDSESFPRPFKVGKRAVRFSEIEIQEYLNELKSRREGS